MAMMIAY